MEHSDSREANSRSASQGMPVFYGARRLITMLIKVCCWFLSEPDESSSLLISKTFKLPSTPRFPNWAFHNNILYAVLICPVRAACHAHT
jgi:hypothetical protein